MLKKVRTLNKQLSIEIGLLHVSLLDKVDQRGILDNAHLLESHSEYCEKRSVLICVEVCSGQVMHPGEAEVQAFDSEKCFRLPRVPVELKLLAGEPGRSRAHERCSPRRHRRLALGRELN